MRVLVACEESQTVCRAFRDKGHEAFSNDLLPTSGDHPEWHLQMDCWAAVMLCEPGWDIIIMHPPCTYLAVSGNAHYADSLQRDKAIDWTKRLFWRAIDRCHKVCLENPVGVLSRYMRPPNQYVQPWQFGHPETKKTGLWLHNLPKLIPTNIVEGREQRIWKMAPSPERAKMRSKTYEGIARAMAEQWG